jgi:hypothetical protein
MLADRVPVYFSLQVLCSALVERHHVSWHDSVAGHAVMLPMMDHMWAMGTDMLQMDMLSIASMGFHFMCRDRIGVSRTTSADMARFTSILPVFQAAHVHASLSVP